MTTKLLRKLQNAYRVLKSAKCSLKLYSVFHFGHSVHLSLLDSTKLKFSHIAHHMTNLKDNDVKTTLKNHLNIANIHTYLRYFLF